MGTAAGWAKGAGQRGRCSTRQRSSPSPPHEPRLTHTVRGWGRAPLPNPYKWTREHGCSGWGTWVGPARHLVAASAPNPHCPLRLWQWSPGPRKEERVLSHPSTTQQGPGFPVLGNREVQPPSWLCLLSRQPQGTHSSLCPAPTPPHLPSPSSHLCLSSRCRGKLPGLRVKAGSDSRSACPAW